jgi:site-specific recombinase XerD
MSFELPLPARRFLRTSGHRRVHLIVHAFHRWLDRRQLTLPDLTPALLKQFLARPGRRRISRRVYIAYRAWLRRYLQWLHDRALVAFVPGPGRPQPQELPALAHTFLATLAPTFRPDTVHCYTFSLRKLYGWLCRHRLAPEHLTRPHIERWLRWLHDAGLHPSSRHHILVESRAYLRWLSERRRMRTPPDDLIRKGDFPRIPRYLPRPLSAEADRELQHRLAASQDPAAWALLLMRHTGLRIGELRDLEFHCVRADEHRPLLKVPLGKLNNERLVPLDVASVELVRRLQSSGPRPRSWLVPGARGARASYHRIRCVLLMHSRGLPDPARITSHRLRHTFATEMLGAGMSLLGVMRLLGHRSYHMTLRYAAVSPDAVVDEYTKALAQLATKYQLSAQAPSLDEAPEPDRLLDQLARWLRKHTSSPQRLRSLLKRIERLRREVRDFQAPKRAP